MAIAFVTIKGQVGQLKEILANIRKIKNVVEAYTVTGPYDIIIKIEGDNLENVAKMIVTKIHEIPGVQDTVSYLAIDL